jgi:RNA recognition motif-containing protein
MIKIFIVGIPREMDATALTALFSEFGDVADVKVITDLVTGKSKGYAFVDLLDETGANLAIKELDGSELEGRTLNVRLAEKQPRPRLPESPVQRKQYEKVSQTQKSKRPRRPKG